MNATQLLPALRDLYSRLPEMHYRQPWELQHVLFSLGYTDELEDEGEIAAVYPDEPGKGFEGDAYEACSACGEPLYTVIRVVYDG